jgi:hypothetical protein
MNRLELIKLENENLNFRISGQLKYAFKKFDIEHTNMDFCYIRKDIVQRLNGVGINYCNFDGQDSETFFLINDAFFGAFNDFYSTNYCLVDFRSFK